MVEDEIFAVDVHAACGLRREFLEQRGREAGEGQAHALELLGIDQSTGAVVTEHELVLVEDVLAHHVLDGRETVADQLEHHIERGQGEADHDEAALACGVLELVIGGAEMAYQVAVAFGLALTGTTQHREELREGLAGQQLPQEHHGFHHALDVDVEVGSREPEHDAGVVLIEHHRVDRQSRLGVLQREHERQCSLDGIEPPDEIRAGALEEDRLEHLERTHACIGVDAAPAQIGRDVLRDVPYAALEVDPRALQRDVIEQVLDQHADITAVAVETRLGVAACALERVEVDRCELDALIDADRAEEPPRNGAEERPCERRVGQPGAALQEPITQQTPQIAVGGLVAVRRAHLGDGAIDPEIVEIDALDRVLLAAVPVAGLETRLRSPGDRAEVRVVPGERHREAPCAILDGQSVHERGRRPRRSIRGCGSGHPRTRCI